MDIKKQNKIYWILTAVVFIFFITYRFCLFNVQWNDRVMPPEPDDSYSYILSIETVINSGQSFRNSQAIVETNPFHKRYITWKILYASLGKITNLTSEQTFYYGFYFGTVLMGLIIILFIKQFLGLRFVPWGLLVLSFFNGHGPYHGFYWVVPSFFTLFTLLSLSSAMKMTKDRIIPKLILYFIFSLASVLLHPIGLIIPLICAPLLILTSLSWPKKIGLLLITGVITLGQYLFIQKMYLWLGLDGGSITSAYAAESMQAATNSLFNAEAISYYKNYFINIIKYKNISVVAVGLSLLFMIKEKRWSILLIILSLTGLSLLSLTNSQGFRLLVLVWPIYLIVFSYFFPTFLSNYILNKKYGLDKYVKIITILLIFISISLFGHTLNTMATSENIRVAERKNFALIDEDLLKFIDKKVSTDDLIIYNSKNEYYYLLANGLLNKKGIQMFEGGWFYEIEKYGNPKDIKNFYILAFKGTTSLKNIYTKNKETIINRFEEEGLPIKSITLLKNDDNYYFYKIKINE